MSRSIVIYPEDKKFYEHLRVDKPRISKRWLFSISGFLAPLMGIAGGFFFTSQWAMATVITYASLWGLTSGITAIALGCNSIPWLCHTPKHKDLENACSELLKKNRLLKAENERLMEALEPQLMEGRKS